MGRAPRNVIVGAAALAVVLALVTCGGDDDDTGATVAPVAGEELLTDAWMYLVASDLGRLAPFEGSTGGPWLSFFHNDLRRAESGFSPMCTPSSASLAEREAAGFPCVGLARANIELAEFYALAAEVDRVALRQFYKHRDEHRDDVLASVHEDFFSGVVLLHSGDREGGSERLSRYAQSEAADPMTRELATLISEGLINGDPLVARIWGGASEDASGHPGLGDLSESADSSNYAARLEFIVAVAQGDAAKAESVLRPIDPRSADLEERLEQVGEEAPAIDPVLRHHDPAFLSARSRYHALRALAAVGDAEELAVLRAQASRLLGRAADLPEQIGGLNEALALVVFSEHPNPADLLAAERAWPNSVATVRRLSAAKPALGSAPSADLADLDPFIEGSNTVTLRLGELLSAAGEHGASLNSDMGLAERFRSHLLRERAVQFQQAFDVHLDATDGADMVGPGVAARSLLELALDKNPSPPNPELKQARLSYLNDPPLLLMLARAELDTRRSGEANDYVRPLTTLYPELISVRDALTILDTAWNPPREGGGVKQGN